MRAPVLLALLFAGASSVMAAPAPIATADISRMSTPWWAARFTAKQHELDTGPSDLVWLGDSITQNWETDGRAADRRE